MVTFTKTEQKLLKILLQTVAKCTIALGSPLHCMG